MERSSGEGFRGPPGSASAVSGASLPAPLTETQILLERIGEACLPGTPVIFRRRILSEAASHITLQDRVSAAANRRVRYLEDRLLEIAVKDWHRRTPPKPHEDGGMRGWAGHKAVWALTGLNGSYHGDAKVIEALEIERAKPWALGAATASPQSGQSQTLEDQPIPSNLPKAEGQ